ncbi:MAG TPA: protein kinase [Polyangiaceae bacterium]|nr:protein kinase [Polyangiaceae bacterium]
MSASGALRVSEIRELSDDGVVGVLRALEDNYATGSVRFETDAGLAEVDFVWGALIDARMEELSGRGALFRLLGASAGSFEVVPVQLEPRAPLAPSVDHLLEDLLQWQRLGELAPPLSSVPNLLAGGRAALDGDELDGEQRALLELVDGRRTYAEIIDESDIDAVDALALLVHAIQKGWLSSPVLKTSLFPLPGGGAAVREAPESSQQPSGVRPSSAPPPSAEASAGAGRNDFDALERDGAGRAGALYIGRYRVLCRIGRGGMGAVYLCRLTSESGFRRLFAVKLLQRHLLDDPDAAGQFLDEARLAGHMHHPNVVSVIDAGIQDSQPYLVMDYVEGGSLRDLLVAHPAERPPDVVVSIVLDALAGLSAAHELVGDDGVPLNVVHCDISPENLLVGVDGVCRVADFGVARFARAATGQRGAVRGKPAYVAPEQVRGDPVDRRADVFAMGAVLYSALTGVSPFAADTVEETLENVCSLPIAPPSTVGLHPPSALDALCLRALERDPARRYATAEEMLLELRKVALEQNLLSPPSNVAAWVRASVGQRLSRRRLVILEASRTARGGAHEDGAGPSDSRGGDATTLAVTELPGADVAHLSRTIVLPEGAPVRTRWAVGAASGLALLLVLLTLFFPGFVAGMFRVSPEPGVPSKSAKSNGTAAATPSTLNAPSLQVRGLGTSSHPGQTAGPPNLESRLPEAR